MFPGDLPKLHCSLVFVQELDKSFTVQRRMLKQQEEIEAESVELQEFLQAEKLALADTVRDMESEVKFTQIYVIETLYGRMQLAKVFTNTLN